MKKHYLIIILLFAILTAKSQTWLWGRVAGFSASGSSNGSGVAIDRSNNAYITGRFDNDVEFGMYELKDKYVAAYLVKYDPNGNVIWAKRDSSTFAGCVSAGFSTATDKRNNIYFTGGFSGTVYFDTIKLVASNYDYTEMYNVFLAKYDSVGKVVWVKQSTSNSSSVTYMGTNANSMALDNLGYIYITGQYSYNINFGTDSTSGGTYFIAKYDSNGNTVWVQSATGSVYALGVCADNFDNVYVTGYYWDSCIFNNIHLYGYGMTAFLIKYNSQGQLIWAQTAKGGASEGYSVATKKNGDIYVTGNYDTLCGFGSKTLPKTAYKNFFLAEFDSAGNALWAKAPTVLDTHEWTGNSVATDQSGNVYCSVIGYEPSGSANYAIAFGVDTFKSQRRSPDGASLIIKFDTSGNVLDGSVLGSGDKDQGSVTTDANGYYIYMTGTLSDTAICGPDTLDDYNNFTTYLARWQTPQSTVGINDIAITMQSITVYPNPSTGIFNFQANSQHPPAGGNIAVYNMLGQEVVPSFTIHNSQFTIDLSGQPKGIYFYRLTNTQGSLIQNGKLLLQ